MASESCRIDQSGHQPYRAFCRLAHPPSKRCAQSYDILRLDVSIPACGLLSSHEDMSVMDTAVITQVGGRQALRPQ